jgi:cyclopropane-fatty-acyl-phospholipid synthase
MTGTVLTSRHYDQSPELFRMFLGRRMKYSSGIYHSASMSLDQAQETKLRYIAGLLRLHGGERVLDIGSGWGSMVLFLAESLNCEVVGVTPSARQAEHILDLAAATGVRHRVSVEVAPFDEASLPECAFDAVTAVGVMEHMPGHVAALTKIRHLLKPGGRLYLSSSCYRAPADNAEFGPRPASTCLVDFFGSAAMPKLSGLIESFEFAGLGITSVSELTAHYKLTIADWQQRIVARRADLERLNPGFADEIIRYFETANASWGYTARHYALTAANSQLAELHLPALAG